MQKLMDQARPPFLKQTGLSRSPSVGNRASSVQRPHSFSRQELEARLHRIRRISRVMDTAVRIPGTKIRLGLDSIIGLVPGFGDAATAGISAWIVREAYQSGVPPHVLAKMVGNIAIDFVGGAVPLAGDLFDVYWKANHRNVQLLEDLLRGAAR